jgi:hypothetical protein
MGAQVAVERKYERDVDVLLAEEFSVNTAFAEWFRSQTKFETSVAQVADVYVSKSDNLGESDLIVIYETEGGSRFALLIEDKVDAPLQPEQVKRYRMRADRGAQQDLWTDYEVILCAPAHYIQGAPELDEFDRRISFEEVANFLQIDASPRSQYRGRFLTTAATKRKNIWTREQDDATDEFWEGVRTKHGPISVREICPPSRKAFASS